ncbi:hypothetical protein BH24CHL4_BH24CHL4_24180 [soil metagenome]
MPTNNSRFDDNDDASTYPADSFIGREQDLSRARRLLQHEDSRLISITGPAGVGKTRLAYELARDAEAWFEGELVTVRLAAVWREAEIVPEIARSLGIVDQAERLELRVQEALDRRPALIVLDNLEHLAPGGLADWARNPEHR